MKAYSSADILGRESYISTLKNPFIYYFESWIEKKSIDVEIYFSIPHRTYLRTKFICDYIETEFEAEFSIPMFIDIILKDFVFRVMKKHNAIKIYEELTKYDNQSQELIINDPINNTTYTTSNQKPSDAELSIYIEKKLLKRSEIILAELDETIGVHFTVEEVISKLWFNFIQSFSDGDEKAIDKLLKMKIRFS